MRGGTYHIAGFDEIGPIGQGCSQFHALLSIGAFLWRENGYRTVRSEQRIVHIAGEYESGVGDGGMQAGAVDPPRVGESGCTPG